MTQEFSRKMLIANSVILLARGMVAPAYIPILILFESYEDGAKQSLIVVIALAVCFLMVDLLLAVSGAFIAEIQRPEIVVSYGVIWCSIAIVRALFWQKTHSVLWKQFPIAVHSMLFLVLAAAALTRQRTSTLATEQSNERESGIT